MRWPSHIAEARALVGWVGCYLLLSHFPMAVAAEPLPAAAVPAPPVGKFDRAALEKELSQPLEALEAEPTEALQAYVRRLGDLHFALELALDVSPEEQRALSDRILSRVGQIGLVIRQRVGEPAAKSRAQPTPAPPPHTIGIAVLWGNSSLLVQLLGGLLVAFVLGYFARGRLLVGKALAVARNVRREETQPPPVPIPCEMPDGRPMTLEEIRGAVSSGSTILLQKGYEIAPNHRGRFLALARQTQEVLHGIDGQTYTVWEDPGHPNRFYELLVCRRLEVLDQLASADGLLSKLAEQIEACCV
ncbi:MAG TPA: hypothetical protein VN203_22615, partial [Candidatus Acidoferrum sp.]|nr:hypothetical protein [Candidatus Acidoferrum sp.]